MVVSARYLAVGKESTLLFFPAKYKHHTQTPFSQGHWTIPSTPGVSALQWVSHYPPRTTSQTHTSSNYLAYMAPIASL
jgi:hypothetical protein